MSRLCRFIGLMLAVILLTALLPAFGEEDITEESKAPAAAILQQPASVAVMLGGKDAVFSVKAENAQRFQWQYNQGKGWKNLIGATENKLVLSAAKGNHGVSYRCEVTGADGQKVYSKAAKLQVVYKGGTVTFGKYEQDNDRDNGKEAIEWQVLAVKGQKALLISRFVLDAKPFHTSEKTNLWEKCSLRKWLNGTFFKQAFTKKEQSAIQKTAVSNEKAQSNWKISGGKNTKDRVFLLSYKEAWTYLPDGRDRVCQATDYARARGVSVYNGLCDVWWLRSPANTKDRAATVYEDGGGMVQVHVYDTYAGVRPAMWVKFSGK